MTVNDEPERGSFEGGEALFESEGGDQPQDLADTEAHYESASPQPEARSDPTDPEEHQEAFFSPRSATPRSVVDRLGRGGMLVLVGSLVLAIGSVAVSLGWLDRARDIVVTGEPDPDQDPPADGWQPAMLIATHDGDGPGQLRGLAVLATDRLQGEATVLLIPTSTVTDVPGFGPFTLEEAWAFGGSALTAVTVDNLLGLRIDGVVALDAASWAAWFEPVGGAGVEVPSRIVARDGPDAGTTRFDPGPQQLAPERVGEYLTVRGEGETELQRLPRVQQVLGALLDAIAEDPRVLDRIVDDASSLPGTATPQRMRTVLGELAEARAEDTVTTITLPVVPLGSGHDEVYRLDEERVEALMDDRFAASRDVDASGSRMAVQILNGNGRPGVGQDVAEQLADGRYRIVLTGNADRFTYRATRILVYSDEPSDLEAARDVQERLGVGTIERAGTPQSVVDLTIIVGADFPPER